MSVDDCGPNWWNLLQLGKSVVGFFATVLCLLTVAIGTCAAQSTDGWLQYKYNQYHTGYNPNTKVKFPMVYKWYKMPDIRTEAYFMTVVGDRVITSERRWIGWGQGLVKCLDASTGSEIWRQQYDDIHSLNQATCAYDMVYIHVCEGQYIFVEARRLEDGALVWRTLRGSQIFRYLGATVANGVALAGTGVYGGLSAYDAYTGEELWWQRQNMWDSWTPTVWGDTVYQFMTGWLHAYNLYSGYEYWKCSSYDSGQSIAPADDWYTMGCAPVLDTATGILYCMWRGSFQAFDLKTHKKLWRITGEFGIHCLGATPALFEGRLYALEWGRLVVYDGPTAQLLWEWVPWDYLNVPLKYPPVIADGYVFVSDTNMVYALNLETHEVEWKSTPGGQVSLANDQIYVVSANGVMYVRGPLPTAVDDGGSEPDLPLSYELKQNYPNPFNATTVIGFSLPRMSRVQIELYNTLGQRVKTLVDAELSAGSHAVEWDGTDASNKAVASGTYLCRFRAGDVVQAKKVTLVK